ncbi:MAG: hypothetical protein H6813_02215 [Phycisphaeraceae bacterium]|nr:hypothetical protein [Phycisphaeraceae bacterium]MCB9848868.1 hypothetical protein [Phycisphaeraceae bacterium]
MSDWNDPNMLGAIFGSSIGVVGAIIGVWGACLGAFAPKGRHRGAMIASGYGFAALGALIAVAGLVLLLSDAVLVLWLGLLQSGLLITVLMLVLIKVAKGRYAQAEERILSAEALRRE